MKYILTIILISKLLLANALSFREVPLNRMIDMSEFICIGRIVNVSETDSLLQKQLKDIVMEESYDYDAPSCGYCNEIAIFVIKKVLKGKIEKDTILIPFYRSTMFALPGFSENQKYILFLDKLANSDFFIKSDPRFGVKDSYLKEYHKQITKYLNRNSESEKRDWIIDLCINPMLSWEGMLNFNISFFKQFSDREKKIMTKGLVKMDFSNDDYTELLKCVQGFCRNEELIEKCFDRLEEIKGENIYEVLYLMEAINEMDFKLEYKELIDKFCDGFNNRLSRAQNLELINEFIQHKN